MGEPPTQEAGRTRDRGPVYNPFTAKSAKERGGKLGERGFLGSKNVDPAAGAWAMMGRGVLTAIGLMFHGWRWLTLVVVTLTVGFMAAGGLRHLGPRYGPANAWDAVVFGAVTAQTLALLVAPVFLLATSRDMTRRWEINVWIRLRSRRVWWSSDLFALAVASGFYALAIGVGALGFGIVTRPFSWGWSLFARGRRPAGLSTFLVTPHSPPPWTVSVETLGLMVLGLWLFAVLTRTLTILFQNPWYGLAVTWTFILCQYGLIQLGITQILPWLPGDQFVFLMHFVSGGPRIPVGWSVAYGIAWLAVLSVVGGVAAHREWSA